MMWMVRLARSDGRSGDLPVFDLQLRDAREVNCVVGDDLTAARQRNRSDHQIVTANNQSTRNKVGFDYSVDFRCRIIVGKGNHPCQESANFREALGWIATIVCASQQFADHNRAYGDIRRRMRDHSRSDMR